MNDKNTNINEEYLEIFQQLICEQLARAELLKEGIFLYGLCPS